MYDRLGEALKDALQKGSIPNVKQRPEEVPPADSNTEGTSIYTQRMKKPRVVRVARMEQDERVGQVLRAGAGGNKAKVYTAQSFAQDAEQRMGFGGTDNSIREKAAAYASDVEAAYAVLGVKAGCSGDEVKAAWREKIKMFHPDSNSSNETVQRVAERKTLEIMDAYQTLLNANVLK